MSLTRTEMTLLGLIALGVGLVAYYPRHFYIGLLLIGVVFLIAAYSQRQVSAANPPQIAIPTFWGVRELKVIKPRIVFVLNEFPLMEDLILIDSQKRELEHELPGIRTRAKEPASDRPEDRKPGEAESGGSVTAKYGLTFEPSKDPKQTHDYLDSGMYQGVVDILDNVADGALREEGASHTWEHLSFSKAALSAKLIGLVTGHAPECRVKRNDRGEPIRNTNPDSPQEYELIKAEPDEKLDELDYRAFLKEVMINGYNDVLGLGIKIRRFNVTEIQPEGVLKEDAERVAREQQQRRAEELDFETERKLAREYIADANKDLPEGSPDRINYDQAMKMVRVNRGRAKEVIVTGSNNPMAVAAAVLKTITPTQPDTEGSTS